MPVPSRTSPAHGQHSVDDLKRLAARAVTQSGEIRNQSDEPEQRRDRAISGNREHVPHQWAAKLWPDPHRVWIGEHPVKQPWATSVQQWKQAGGGNRKERHRFRKTVDRGTPLLTQQQQDGGNQGAGVTNTNPPNKVDDVERPTNGYVVAPDADAGEDEMGDREQQELDQEKRDSKTDEPPQRSFPLQDQRADLVGD